MALAVATAVLSLTVWLTKSADGATCPSTGRAAPTVVTLMAAGDSLNEAWIVSPDCSVRRLTTSMVDDMGPGSNPYVAGDDLTWRKVLELTSIPSAVERIESVPDNARSIRAYDARLTRGADFSNNLYLLRVFLGEGFSASLSAIKLPNSVVQFDISRTSVTALRGLKLPSSLLALGVNGPKIGYVEFRESDVKVLAQLSGLETLSTQSTCEANSRVQAINAMTVCVISDARFEELYASSSPINNNQPSVPSSPGGTSVDPSTGAGGGGGGGGGGESEGGANGSDGAPTSPNTKTTKPRKNTNGTTVLDSSDEGSGSAGSMFEPAREATRETKASEGDLQGSGEEEESSMEADGTPRRPGRTASPDSASKIDRAKHALQSSSVSPVLIASLAVGAFCVFALIVMGRRRLCKSRSSRDDIYTDSSKFTQTGSSEFANSEGASTLDDVLNDKALFPFHIDKKNVRIGALIARGGCGEIHRGTYQGREVVVKQMMRVAWRDEARRADFAAEIRMCARLDHPRITEFIGITWTDRRTVSIVLEFMDGGDLHQHLEMQPAPSPNSWSQPWTSSLNSILKDKASIAQDVAEAIVYLHSFQTPILHRDLKARNVLLNTRGDAKLGDFGISREVAIDETMTREIGTAAWIAPEVLRGKRYGEKADIYSFGVLLVEMDLCRHPFSKLPAHGLELAQSTTNAAYQNAQLIVAIGNGDVCPAVSSECPDEIRAIASECLVHNPESRPSAMEVFYRLRRFSRSLRP